MQLTANLVEAFSGAFLSPLYDDAKPTPDLHRAGWRLYCSDAPQAAIAAPREHAKSTAFTHDYALSAAVFRTDQYIILVSSTEEMAIEHLGDISKELHENEELRSEFGIVAFESDQRTDIVVVCSDGYKFRIIARGAGQKMRGRKWMGKRPSLIICDDLEDDEQVESKEGRKKFLRWFFRALKPALRDGGKIRVHGTILHEDSLLARLMRDKTWKTLFYKAHRSFDDFSEILWPEKFPEERLRAIRESFIAQGDAAGYSQEYLNDPFDNDEAFLRKDDCIPMDEEDHKADKVFCAAADFAISTKDSANRTSITVGGKCLRNLLHFVDQSKGRWNTNSIIEELFDTQKRWGIDVFFVEDGVIWKALSPIIYREMQKRDLWINFHAILPIKDKATRGRSLQRRHRAGGCRFDKEASWYPDYEAEILRFTGRGEAVLDDQFDSSALLSRGFELLNEIEKEDVLTEDEQEFEYQSRKARRETGRSAVTGY